MKCPRIALALFAVLLAIVPAWAESQTELVFVGSGKKNVEAFRFDLAAGVLTRVGQAAEIEHPSFLSIAPNHKFLYAISEGGNAEASGISAFAIDAAAGKLTFLNRQPAGGSGPCYVEVDPSGKNALIANYGSGSFAVFPLAENGAVQPASALMQDHGSSVNPDRQEGPHGHCLVAGPTDQFAYGCDLGLDKVAIFKFDPGQGKLVLNEPAFAPTKPGAGPRHIAFHPNGRWAFVITEMASTLTVFGCDATSGALQEIQTVSTLPDGFSGQNTCAEVAAHPSGKFVYGSNRGDDSIVVNAFDTATGKLSFVQRMTDGIKVPRNYAIDPSGKWLVCGNLTANTVTVYGIDPDSGKLALAGTIRVPEPLCVRFLQI